MYTIIDIEGNGAGYRQESIIDIAIFKFDGREIVDQFMSLVNPEADITPYVQKLTNITPKMVKTAPKFHEIAKRVVEITAGTTLVGHNIEYDYRMLRQAFKRLGYDYKINTLDTIPLAKKLIPDLESYSLGKLVRSVGIPIIDQHRAAGDARATVELFKLLLSKDADNEIIQKQFEETNAKTYINKVKELTQDLPNEKGILYLQDKAGKILYSDYVLDINKSAKKLFNSKSKRFEIIQELSEQSHFELVGNDLLAKLMLKTKGIKKIEKLPFGLHLKKGKYVVEKNSLNPDAEPLVKFKSFTQGKKALSFINNHSELKNNNVLEQLVNLKGRNELWTMQGRKLAEKAFIVVEKGKITHYGFYDYYNQIQTQPKRENLQIKVGALTADVLNEMKLALLQGTVEIFPLTK